MKRALILMSIALAVVVGAHAPALAQFTGCGAAVGDPAGTFLIDTPADATLVAAGYKNQNCDVTVTHSIVPSVKQFTIEARSLGIQGASGALVQIHNTLAGGEVNLRARVGNLVLSFADIYAPNFVRLRCDNQSPVCQITGTDSSIIAAEPFVTAAQLLDPNHPKPTAGALLVNAGGPVLFTRSTVYGGAFVEMDSQKGSITWICQSGDAGGCLDPLVNQTGLKAVCGDPPVFPCTLNNINDAHNLCVPVGGGVFCGGASKEMRLTAFTDVNLQGLILALDHATFDAKNGDVNAAGSQITVAAQLVVVAKRKIDLKNAVWTAKALRMNTGNLCAAPAICIDLEGALITVDQSMTITANSGNGIINGCDAELHVLGSGVPRLNGDSTPADGYDPNVLDTAAECAPKNPVIVS